MLSDPGNARPRYQPAYTPLTGGLWFVAALTKEVDSTIRFGLLFFAGICNLALVLAAFRIRDVLESYFEKLRAFNEASYASGSPAQPVLGIFGNYSMISIYCALMLVASGLSFIGAFFFYWPFDLSHWSGIAIFALILFMLMLALFRFSYWVSIPGIIVALFVLFWMIQRNGEIR